MERRKTYFDILNRLSVTQECNRQKGGRTDIVLANAALNYVVRPKTDSQTRRDRRTRTD